MGPIEARFAREHRERRRKFFPPATPAAPDKVPHDVPEPADNIIRQRVPSRRKVAEMDIISVVSTVFGVGVIDILSESQLSQITGPRFAAIFLAKKLTGHGNTALGRSFNRDQSSISKALNRANWRLKTDSDYAAKVSAAEAILRKNFNIPATEARDGAQGEGG